MATLAPSLQRLFAEVNKRWPGRDNWSDGWLGDDSHATRFSDHNPDDNGVVHAVDIDATLRKMTMGSGPVGDTILATLLYRARNGKAPQINYLIYKSRIYSRSYRFRARYYTGTNKHDSHVHVSISRTYGARNYSGSWGLLVDDRPILDMSKSQASARREPGSPTLRLNPTNTKNVSLALHRVGLLQKIYVTGHWSKRKRDRYALWQVRCGAKAGTSSASGLPGEGSLRRLAEKANMRYRD